MAIYYNNGIWIAIIKIMMEKHKISLNQQKQIYQHPWQEHYLYLQLVIVVCILKQDVTTAVKMFSLVLREQILCNLVTKRFLQSFFRPKL